MKSPFYVVFIIDTTHSLSPSDVGCQSFVTLFCGLCWTLAFILRMMNLVIRNDPLERGTDEKIVVANLGVLGGSADVCAGRHGRTRTGVFRQRLRFGKRHCFGIGER